MCPAPRAPTRPSSALGPAALQESAPRCQLDRRRGTAYGQPMRVPHQTSHRRECSHEPPAAPKGSVSRGRLSTPEEFQRVRSVLTATSHTPPPQGVRSEGFRAIAELVAHGRHPAGEGARATAPAAQGGRRGRRGCVRNSQPGSRRSSASPRPGAPVAVAAIRPTTCLFGPLFRHPRYLSRGPRPDSPARQLRSASRQPPTPRWRRRHVTSRARRRRQSSPGTSCARSRGRGS